MELKKNDVVRTHIDGAASGGEGVAHIEGQAVFVKGALPGEECEAHILRSQRGVVWAKADAVIAAYDSTRTAKSSGQDSINDIGGSFLSVVFGAIKAPLIETLKNVINGIGDAFFSFLDFLFKPITELFPFC